jgi:UDP-2,4-diacetamido-2,4,6-trideoxy-beta-L-altropyranose hydrolase
MSDTLLIRADGSASMGLGHVMRCLALAQAWQDRGGRCVMVSRPLPDALGKRLLAEGLHLLRVQAPVEDASEIVHLAEECGASALMLDGYHFPADYHRALHRTGLSLLLMDDMAHLESYGSDILLNQNLHARPGLYAGRLAPCTKLLAGPRYALLRREFRQACPRGVGRSALRHLLITFGGSDPENLTAQVLDKLTDYPELIITVLAGAANPHLVDLQKRADSWKGSLRLVVDAADVTPYMVEASAAIAAGGSTVWELAAMRVPTVVVGVSVDQMLGLSALRDIGFFDVIEAASVVQDSLIELLQSLLSRLSGLALAPLAAGIDAFGADRVVAAMMQPKVESHEGMPTF